MKKIKSLLIFTFALFAIIMTFCMSAGAIQYNEREGEIEYSYDEYTGVMTVKGTGGTLRSRAFGFLPYTNLESDLESSAGQDVNWENMAGYAASFYDVDENTAASAAARKTKILIVDESVTSLEPMCFYYFENVETVILPDNITEIPAGAFYQLKNLKTAVISYAAEKISDYAFIGCENLKNINIGKTVEYIGTKAFSGCDFEYITIPDTVETVKEGNSLIPENIKAAEVSLVTDDRAVLSWQKADNATGYRVFSRIDGKWQKLADVKGLNYSAEELESNKSYNLAVRPFNNVGGKTYWAPSFVRLTVETAPKTPVMKVSSAKTGTVSFAWNNISGETGYQIWYSLQQNKGFTKISNYTADTVKAVQSGFISGQTYYFRIRTYKKTSEGYVYSDFSPLSAVKIK